VRLTGRGEPLDEIRPLGGFERREHNGATSANAPRYGSG
jgi:hypothetical protein